MLVGFADRCFCCLCCFFGCLHVFSFYCFFDTNESLYFTTSGWAEDATELKRKNNGSKPPFV